MRINFILPGPGNAPVGGFKIAYEYANRLAARGHRVTVAHQALRRLDRSRRYRYWRMLRYWERRLTRSWRPDKWFELRSDVNVLWVPMPNSRNVPVGDVVVATSWETAENVVDYPADRGLKFYLIQHIEDWSGPRVRVEQTWRLPLRKIVISHWLKEAIENIGEDSILIPNGLDSHEFGIDILPAKRYPKHLVMPWSEIEWKGSRDGLDAVKLVFQEHPDLQLDLFGVGYSPKGLQNWMSYYRNPSRTKLRALYNKAAIFVGPSWSEGWGLPPCEAMLSGAAAAITDNPGHREFSVHEVNALMSPPKHPEKLAENIIRLLNDHELRLQLAVKGAEDIRAFDWERSVLSMERLFENQLSKD
jgi:glycosyltransferase involved in cell wall biosynthesis